MSAATFVWNNSCRIKGKGVRGSFNRLLGLIIFSSTCLMSIQVHIAGNQATCERVYHFRYQIHTLELGHESPHTDHEKAWVHDEADETATILYAEKDGHIVGTLRININDKAFPRELSELLKTTEAEKKFKKGEVAITGRLMIDPRLRGQTLASLLMVTAYQLAINKGVKINFSTCSLPLVKIYNRLGFRQYEKIIRSDGVNARVPLVLTVRDYKFLLKVMSPFALSLNDDIDDKGESEKILKQAYPQFQWETNNVVCDMHTLWADLADAYARTWYFRPTLFDGLSKEEIQFVLNQCGRLHVKREETVQNAREYRPGLGIVLKGKIGDGIKRVNGSYHWLELFKEGDLFGETKVTQDLGRVSELVAIEDSEIAMISPNLIDKAKKRDPILATRLTMNIITFMQKRLSDLENVIHVDPPEEEKISIVI